MHHSIPIRSMFDFQINWFTNVISKGWNKMTASIEDIFLMDSQELIRMQSRYLWGYLKSYKIKNRTRILLKLLTRHLFPLSLLFWTKPIKKYFIIYKGFHKNKLLEHITQKNRQKEGWRHTGIWWTQKQVIKFWQIFLSKTTF